MFIIWQELVEHCLISAALMGVPGIVFEFLLKKKNPECVQGLLRNLSKRRKSEVQFIQKIGQKRFGVYAIVGVDAETFLPDFLNKLNFTSICVFWKDFSTVMHVKSKRSFNLLCARSFEIFIKRNCLINL